MCVRTDVQYSLCNYTLTWKWAEYLYINICSDSGRYTAEEEELIWQFDMDMSYGPCIGVTRLRRWERAAAMGLRPPPHLRDLILLRQQHHGGGGGVVVGSSSPPPKSKSDIVVSQLECLWAGKV